LKYSLDFYIAEAEKRLLAQRRKARQVQTNFQIRNPKFETNPNDQNLKIPNNFVLDFDFWI